MTIQLCSLHSYYQNYWADEIQEEHWPVSFQPSERLNAGKNPSHPGILFSPLHGIMEVWCPSKKRAVVDRFCDRLKKSQCAGVQLAIDYLHEKYSQNLAAATTRNQTSLSKRSGGEGTAFQYQCSQDRLFDPNTPRSPVFNMSFTC